MHYSKWYVGWALTLGIANLYAKTEHTSTLKTPKLVLVVVIDQLPYQRLTEVGPFLKGGLKQLIDTGVHFTNAFHPQGMPETSVDHTGIGTGTTANIHGIIGNTWNDEKGNTVECDADHAETAAVFSPTGTYAHGKSAKNIMVDTLADQLTLHSYPFAKNKAWSLSLKSRSAIGMAGRLGKAIWFDGTAGAFTSSKAYFAELPSWVKEFNNKHSLANMKEFTWKPYYPADSKAYDFPYAKDYTHAAHKTTLINVATPIDHTQAAPFEFYAKTPLASKLLLDLAYNCLQNELPQDDERLVLYISISNQDLIGHVMGAYVQETYDSLYHIDAQLGTFLQKVRTLVKPEDTLTVLTSDHGVFPILELVKERGITFAKRTDVAKVMQRVNSALHKEFGLEKFITHHKTPQFYCDAKQLAALDEKTKKQVFERIKTLLRQESAIADAWTFDELTTLSFPYDDVRNLLKNQLYRGRSGQIIYLVRPYNYLDDYHSGTSHGTPYNYDTHVPLIVQHPALAPQKIENRVYIQQLPVTLAALLKVPRPSASTFNPLPGLLPQETV